MAETWRVVLASGEVLSVEAWTDADGVPWARHRTASGEDLVCSHTPREAVVRAVAYAYSGIVEILAPGEPTRAELAAQHADLARLRAEHAAALDAARREGAEGMREVVKAEIHAAFHYNDPPDDGRERPIAPRAGEWEAHQTLRKLLSRVCVVLTEGGAS